jgi:hypothetical protein
MGMLRLVGLMGSPFSKMQRLAGLMGPPFPDCLG